MVAETATLVQPDYVVQSDTQYVGFNERVGNIIGMHTRLALPPDELNAVVEQLSEAQPILGHLRSTLLQLATSRSHWTRFHGDQFRFDLHPFGGYNAPLVMVVRDQAHEAVFSAIPLGADEEQPFFVAAISHNMRVRRQLGDGLVESIYRTNKTRVTIPDQKQIQSISRRLQQFVER